MANKASKTSHYSDLAVQTTCDDAASCKRFKYIFFGNIWLG